MAKDFINNFRMDPSDLLAPPYYEHEIRSSYIRQNQILHMDASHIKRTDDALYQNLVMNPEHTIMTIEEAIFEKVLQIKEELYAEDPSLTEDDLRDRPEHMLLRPYNLHVRQQRNVRDLNPSDILQLVAIRGIVTRVSEIIPELYEAIFRCTARNQQGIVCNHAAKVLSDQNEVVAPLRCDVCQFDGAFRLSDAESKYRNKQLIRLQEAPETIPEGETPQTLLVYVLDDLVDVCRPGDRVEVTGEYKAKGQRVVPRARRMRSVFRTFVEATNIRKAPESARVIFDADGNETKIFQPAVQPVRDSDDIADETGAPQIDATLLERLTEWHRDAVEAQDAGREKVSDRIVRSFAPSIFEYEDVKKGILCQLVGGTEVAANGAVLRGEINILMCGDPGTAKSQLLQQAHKHTPRGVFTSGKGSSAVGLTAYVTRDPDTNELVLESGALVLSDRGVCCIDEFDKMDEGARAILNEVMEQQTVSVAKAGVVATLHARTAILAAANPLGSRWLPSKSVPENLNFPAALLSRFDLIYVILDRADAQKDRDLARHLCLMYTEGGNHTAKLHRAAQAAQAAHGAYGGPNDNRVNGSRVVSGEDVDMATVAAAGQSNIHVNREVLTTKELSAFIAHTRRTYHPVLTADAARRAVKEYVEMRDRGRISSSRSVAATPRHLDSLIRIAQGLAKLEWLEEVAPEHIAQARQLMDASLLTFAVNPATGAIDFGALELGQQERDARAQLLQKDAAGAGGLNDDFDPDSAELGAGGKQTPMTNMG